jgi:hypothetical protein
MVDLSAVTVDLLYAIRNKFLELTYDDRRNTLYDFFHFILLNILLFSVLPFKLSNQIVQEIVLLNVELDEHCTSHNCSTK